MVLGFDGMSVLSEHSGTKLAATEAGHPLKLATRPELGHPLKINVINLT